MLQPHNITIQNFPSVAVCIHTYVHTYIRMYVRMYKTFSKHYPFIKGPLFEGFSN